VRRPLEATKKLMEIRAERIGDGLGVSYLLLAHQAEAAQATS